MTRCVCGHLSDAHKITNGVCLWKDCWCISFEPHNEVEIEQFEEYAKRTTK